ncbi:ATP-binding protein [Crossiella sp. SN42]|uniref:sensor histidine kinase n=1 Tax=Crossiella sp. SN42 TaxID=2944808 RepID=UPI00207D0E16|nr:ATP-binding protein [Crossiella sp. SN42]MCO1580672.1 ATP-binding protein [Crossiella sp. SN42]
MRRRVSPHRSLVVKLLASSVLIAVAAVGLTMWLTATTTSEAIRQEQGQVLADDASIYDGLAGYAATHPSWAEVGPLVRELAARTGRRIAVTDQDRRILADSAAPGTPLPARTAAVVDPLRLDPALAPGAALSLIDARAIGPFRLSEQEREQSRLKAERMANCLRGAGMSPQTVVLPNGRAEVKAPGPLVKAGLEEFCDQGWISDTEKQALDEVNKLAAGCLREHGQPRIRVAEDFTWYGGSGDAAVIRSCVDDARREQLRPHVSPAALLFLASQADPRAQPDPVRVDTSRLLGLGLLVLALTVGVTVLVGGRLVRPLRLLTEAASADGRRRVPVTTRDEIGVLARAFNDLADRRQRLEEQRKAMVSDIAHELRTPLTTIRGGLEAAQDGVAVPDDAWLSSQLEEVLLLQHIIDDLQDLAAADAGAFRLHPEPVSVPDLLEQVAGAHRARAEQSGITLRTEIDGDPELHADPVRLRQLVGNLVANALRHTPAGGEVVLAAGTERAEVVISVADNGSGITEADLPLVFERFWRAEKSRNRGTGGSGLGLAIVRQLAEAHGGTVTATSTPGVATVFTLRLPADQPS